MRLLSMVFRIMLPFELVKKSYYRVVMKIHPLVRSPTT